ncbi:MAG: TIGR03936 family radical SAM-associated protein [Clostridia bacterium]
MFKARMLFKKEGRAKYISHLDNMQAIQRSIARAKLPIWHTEGFNPHAYISIALPLSTGFSSEYELLDFNFLTEDVPENAIKDLNMALPSGFEVLDIYKTERKAKEMKFSQYDITYDFDDGRDADFIKKVQDLFNQDEVIVVKRTKRSEKEVNIKEFIAKLEIFDIDENTSKITVITCAGDPNLSPEYITKAIEKYLPEIKIDGAYYHRTCIFDKDLVIFK